ncbi:MAG: isoamylase [Actinomycetia bacterium]|nr:isoamylase [Actinomycetes bacterium]MCP4957747.1 isoamylase [Actinomycetes bacterium]
MIKRKSNTKADQVTVTFSLDETRPVSVVGDFNEWDPLVTPLKKRSNGLRSAAVKVPTGSELRFRYLVDGGEFQDEPEADRIEPNGYGQSHSVVLTSA